MAESRQVENNYPDYADSVVPTRPVFVTNAC